MPDTSLIFDCETLATDPNAIVTEIGCIAVNREDFTIIAQLDLKPQILTQLADGRSYTRDTIEWHERKKTLPTRTGEISIKDSVHQLAAFIREHNPSRIWAWGKDFERPLYENLCRSYGVEIEDYQFRKFTCARDVWQLTYGMEDRPPERTHRALQDCHDELRDLRQALNQVNLVHSF